MGKFLLNIIQLMILTGFWTCLKGNLVSSNTLIRILLIIFLWFSSFSTTSAQEYTDSLSLKHSPSKAALLSAVLPGAGQVYNKKYWKVPVIYAGFATLGYFIKFNNDNYQDFKDAYIARVDGDESTTDEYVGIYSDQDLQRLKDFYRRNRDLSFVGITLLYVLNIVDASVDAHLFYFNVNDDLTLRWQPGVSNVSGTYTPGINLALQF